jgi:flavorubredoxin
MTVKLTEIAADTYRISAFHSGKGMQFNEFLIVDDEPFLMHTGPAKMFPETLDAVARVIEPARLRWIGFSHFEADECGALNDWLRAAPRAEPACSFVGAMVNMADVALRPARALKDGEVLQTGRHRLRFLATPHVPHGWDAGLFFDESEATLLCSDLFFHPGDPEPLTESDILDRARTAIETNLAGPMANDLPYTRHTQPTLERLASLEPRTLALMHGSAFRGDGRQLIVGLGGVLRELLGPSPWAQ